MQKNKKYGQNYKNKNLYKVNNNNNKGSQWFKSGVKWLLFLCYFLKI